jgi:hypothetical protein
MMLAREVLENPGQDKIALNRKRSEELILEIFETLSEGIVKFAGHKSTKEAQQLSSEFVSCKLSMADLLLKEKERV